MVNKTRSRWAASDSPATAASTRPTGPSSQQSQGPRGSTPGSTRSGDSFLRTLLRLWPQESEPAPQQNQDMRALRTAFRAVLTDLARINPSRTDELLRHILSSRNPTDLLHLRASIFTELARAFSQSEAERRLAGLNVHFQSKRKSFHVL
jgi:hypothetical protein